MLLLLLLILFLVTLPLDKLPFAAVLVVVVGTRQPLGGILGCLMGTNKGH